MPYGYKQPGNWQTIRRRILNRDSHACYVCGGPATQVDHLTPVAQGGTHEEQNLAAICEPHHDAKSAVERVEGRRRSRARMSRTPEPHPGVIPPSA